MKKLSKNLIIFLTMTLSIIFATDAMALVVFLGVTLIGFARHGTGFIKFFDLASSKLIKQDKAPMHVHDLVLSDNGSTIYAAGHGKAVVWSLVDG